MLRVRIKLKVERKEDLQHCEVATRRGETMSRKKRRQQQEQMSVAGESGCVGYFVKTLMMDSNGLQQSEGNKGQAYSIRQFKNEAFTVMTNSINYLVFTLLAT